MLTVVTAASETYRRSLYQFLRSIARRDDPARHRIVAWDLGLSAASRSEIERAFPWCVMRTFENAAWPAHAAADAGTYAWKPIAVAATAEEFGGLILWLDSATIMKGPFDPLISIIERIGTVSLQGQARLDERCEAAVLEALEVPPEAREKPERVAGVVGFDTERPEMMHLIGEWRRLALDAELIAPSHRTIERHMYDQALLGCLLLGAETRGEITLNTEDVDISSPNPMHWLTTRNKIPTDRPLWTLPLYGLWHDSYKTIDQALHRWHRRQAPTAGQLRDAFPAENAEDERSNQWPVFYLFRPLSRHLTPWLLKAGIGADAVTLLGLALTLAMPAVLVLSDPWAGLLLGVMACLFQVIDCVDGDIARFSGTASRRGAYLDAATDVVSRMLFYVAAGMLAARAPVLDRPLVEGAAAGLLCAWLYLFCRFLRDWTSDGKASVPSAPPSGAMRFLIGLDHAFGLVLAAVALLGHSELFFGLLCLYALGDLIMTQSAILRRLR